MVSCGLATAVICDVLCFSTLSKACLSSDFLIRFTTKRPKVSCANGCTVPLVPDWGHAAMLKWAPAQALIGVS